MRRVILIELFLLFFLLPNLYGATTSEQKSAPVATTETAAASIN
ncbi:MAG: hypothetical protein WB699_10120 [Bacteroidota bacterium]